MPTLAELRKRFYDRFDEGQLNYIQVAEANQLINEGAAHFHNWLVSEAEYMIWKEATLPLVPGQSDYPLPTDFMKMLKVFGPNRYPVAAGPASVSPLQRMMPEEYRGLNMGAYQGPFPQYPQAYMMLGNSLRIMPVPSTASGSLLYWYAPMYTPLVLDTDVTPAILEPGWEEFIINQAVIAARIKEESDPGPIQVRQGQIMAMIQSSIINRDMGRSQRVVDVSYQQRW